MDLKEGYITYTTKFGKTIYIPTSRYFAMTDDELDLLEERAGTEIEFDFDGIDVED